jgi:TM2 domain-containing membrane protein YozV
MNGQPPPLIYKNPGLAAVLSFFWMGLGQIYNGQLAKGIVFIVAYGLSWLLMIIVIGFITTPLLWLFGIYDAYKSAEKINVAMAHQASQSAAPPDNQFGTPPQE